MKFIFVQAIILSMVLSVVSGSRQSVVFRQPQQVMQHVPYKTSICTSQHLRAFVMTQSSLACKCRNWIYLLVNLEQIGWKRCQLWLFYDSCTFQCTGKSFLFGLSNIGWGSNWAVVYLIGNNCLIVIGNNNFDIIGHDSIFPSLPHSEFTLYCSFSSWLYYFCLIYCHCCVSFHLN